MPFYSFEMVIVGAILLSAMTFGGVHLWRKRRKEAKQNSMAKSNQNLESDNPVDPAVVNLIGSNSFDPNGTIVAYLWVQTGGPAAAPVVPTNADTTFVINGAGTYSYRLTITDNDGFIDIGAITIIVT